MKISPASTYKHFGIGNELEYRYRHVFRRRPVADAPGGIVDRPVARAEPAAELAFLAKRDAAEMGADLNHDHPGFLAGRGAVGVGRRRVARQVGVAGDRVLEVAEFHVL